MEEYNVKKTRRWLLASIAWLPLILAPNGAIAHSYKLGDIAIGHVSASIVDNGRGIAVYGPILNQGGAVAQLTGASTPIAEDVRIRLATEEDVRWFDTVEFKPGKPFAFAPWRQHLWLTGLKQDFNEGDTFELTLDFGVAGSVTVQVEIEPEGGH